MMMSRGRAGVAAIMVGLSVATIGLVLSPSGCGVVKGGSDGRRASQRPELVAHLAVDASGSMELHVIVLLWDGENSGSDIEPLVEELAAEGQLRAVWVVGVRSCLDDPQRNFRSRVEDEFGRLGRRQVVSGLEDRESGLREFEMLVAEIETGG